jgi:predicted CoA-binding protein
MTDEDFERIIEDLEDKLEKAVEGLRNIAVVGFSSDPSVNAAIARQTVMQARAALAEIEGEK